MYNLLEYLKSNYLFLITIILELFIIIYLLFVSVPNKQEVEHNNNIISYEDSDKNYDIKELVNVDIKGAIKKQGLYKIEKGSTIYDVIRKSGGLKNNATTIDINLSKQVYNEMVIYISTKDEYKKRNNAIKCNNSDSVSNIIASKDSFVSDYNNNTANKTIINYSNNDEYNSDSNNQIININTATKEEMLKIPGIGESKADKIISYRNENGLFKSKEDLKNVSGIGDSIYEKIKDYITI